MNRDTAVAEVDVTYELFFCVVLIRQQSRRVSGDVFMNVRILSFAGALIIIMFSLAGFTGIAPGFAWQLAPAGIVTETTSEAQADAPLSNFSWNPHVYSDVYRIAHGEKTEQAYYELVDAILTGSERFSCPDAETMYLVFDVARTCFPPVVRLISGYAYDSGEVMLFYATDARQREQMLHAFAERISEIVRTAVRDNDSPLMAAIALYHHYAGLIAYDTAAADNDVIVDVSCYRALTEFSGICQSFAGAYAYLCLQCDIDAVNVSGMNAAFEAHEWTMLTLDGRHYYADPTFENGVGGTGLRYFGMTAAERELEGGFVAADYNIGNSNVIFGRDIDVSDERFAPLRDAVSVTYMERGNGALLIHCERLDGSPFLFVAD